MAHNVAGIRSAVRGLFAPSEQRQHQLLVVATALSVQRTHPVVSQPLLKPNVRVIVQPLSPVFACTAMATPNATAPLFGTNKPCLSKIANKLSPQASRGQGEG